MVFSYQSSIEVFSLSRTITNQRFFIAARKKAYTQIRLPQCENDVTIRITDNGFLLVFTGKFGLNLELQTSYGLVLSFMAYLRSRSQGGAFERE